MTLLIIIIALALIFDYINGFHDAANSIATVVSTKVLTPFQAVLWAAFFNVVAFFIFTDHNVANTISKTVSKEFITLPVILAGLIAAIFWNLLTWWYGIPSSSSHTLIGGFAGSALCAAFLKDHNVHITQVIDSGKVLKTVGFIFLAPLIGMLISIFFTIVFINRNTWLKCLILAALGVVLWFTFINFQTGKVNENLTKFLRIDKNSKIVTDETLKLETEKDPSKIDGITKKIKEAQEKVDKAKANLILAEPIVKQSFESKGADFVAVEIMKTADLKITEVSRIGDKLNLYFRTEQLKSKSSNDKQYSEFYEAAKAKVDSCKVIAKKFHEIGEAKMVELMLAKTNITDMEQIKKFTEKMHTQTVTDLGKDLGKSNNRTLRYMLIGALIIFILSFIYTEKMNEPSAARSANLFKRLQLLSSAGFSIGHGGNDAQKVMGIIMAALIANGNYTDFKEMPEWVSWACYAAIGLGTLSGGWKIVKTMGTKITKVTPLEGVSAETAGATTLFLAEQMGIPVSTTHTITGAIIGVGATKRLSAVRWGVTINLLWAWILTIPVSATVAALCYLIWHFVTK
jgi:inorganic phosphate transporter, PiT family